MEHLNQLTQFTGLRKGLHGLQYYVGLTDYAWADMVANMDYIDVGLTMLTWVYTLADRVYSLS